MNIKLLQWNICRKESPDNIVNFVKKVCPDIFTAQEVTQNSEDNIDNGKYISKKLGFNYYYQYGDTWLPAKNNKTSQGNAIFSHFPLNKNFFSYLSPPFHNPPDANYEGRVYVEISLNMAGKILTIGTTHLSFSPRFVINKRKRDEIDNLIPIIKSRTNYIFAGDLNTLPDSYPIKQLQKYFIHAGPNFKYPTWTTKPFDYHGQFKEDKLRWRLDYIFVSKDIKLISSKIIETKYSDHLPILLTINL